MLDEETSQLRALLQTFNLLEGVCLGVETPQAGELVQVIQFAETLEMDVQLVVEIERVVVEAPMLAITQLSNYLTLKGSFSAVSKPIFARLSRYALESSRRDLQNALLCTVF